MGSADIGKKRIAIQGGYGAFHEIAAMHYFNSEEIEIVPRSTFKDLFKSLKMRQAEYGIMAIENSLAGSILPNYTLIRESKQRIIGEIYLRIKQNLVVLPGVTIDDLIDVYSHPMAILQCQEFFEHYPHIRLIESSDTALSAKEIKEKQMKSTGAIASQLAAEKYELEVLFSGIETNKMNYTRFLIVTDNGDKPPEKEINKSSICFALSHTIGGLSKILSILSYYNMNLTKIQSLPIIGRDWEYQFYLDMELEDYALYKKAIEAIEPFTSELGVLGEYTKGRKII